MAPDVAAELSPDTVGPFRFEHPDGVRWVDLDAAGVLNNAVYLTLLEQARLGYFGRLGLLRGDDDQFPFLLGDTRVRYLRPGRPGPVVVATRVTRLGTKSFDMEYAVRQGESVLAVARAVLVWVDDDLASVRIPDDARARIADAENL